MMNRKSALLLLALGFGAALQAQNVTVVMQDGTQKKFAADRIESMVFEEADNNGDLNVVLPEISLDVWSGRNVGLTLADKAKGLTLCLDCYMPDQGYFPAGDYTVKSGNTPFTIAPDAQYSYLDRRGVKQAVKSGTMKVSEINGVDYTFTCDFILADDTRLQSKSQVAMPRFGRMLEVTFGSAAYGTNPTDTEMKVNFAYYSNAWDCETTIVFNVDPGTQTLPLGEYLFSGNEGDMTFGEDSNVHLFKPESNNRIIGGTIFHDLNAAGEDTFEIELTLANGRPARMYYEGKISGAPSYQTRAASLMKAPISK